MRSSASFRTAWIAAAVITLALPTRPATARPGALEDGSQAPPVSAPRSDQSDGAGQDSGRYEFTTDWFSENIPVWQEALEPFKGQPNLHYLEVGVFEGMSLLWALDHILTHPSSKLTGIDIEITAKLLSNLQKSGRSERVTLLEGPSQIRLRELPPESFDIIYIDGSHTADDVMADAVLSWELLKVGGVVIFDDVLWDGSHHTGGGRLPPVLVPGFAIASFVPAHLYEISIVHQGYQLILKKKENPCGEIKRWCSPIGQYVYNWQKHRLSLPGKGTEAIEISDRERELIERYLLTGPARDEAAKDQDYIKLRDRLGLDLLQRI